MNKFRRTIKMSNFRTMLMSTAAVGLASVLATPASAGEVEKSASFGGHVNRTLSVLDDGDSTKLKSGDSGVSMSRVRFQGSAKSESLTTKAYIEVRARGQRSNSNVATGATANQISMRHSYVSLGNSMGTLIIGDTNPAGDLNGWASGQFSGSWAGQDGDTLGGGEFATFALSAAGDNTGQEEGNYAGVTPRMTMSSGRGGVVRYDSPDFNGFSVKASIKGGADADEEPSISFGYSADYDGTKVTAGYGYTNRSGSVAAEDAMHSVGAGILLESGINFHAGYFERTATNANTIESAMWVTDLGYNMSVVDAGATSVKVTYAESEESLVQNDDLEWYGISVQQELSEYGTSLYGGMSNASYTGAAGTNYDDLTSGWVGVRVTF
jgi:hypothetical protein